MLHVPRTPIAWIEVKPGQIWGWKDWPEDTTYFIKIHSKRGNLWHMTDNIDISENDLKKTYILLHESVL